MVGSAAILAAARAHAGDTAVFQRMIALVAAAAKMDALRFSRWRSPLFIGTLVAVPRC